MRRRFHVLAATLAWFGAAAAAQQQPVVVAAGLGPGTLLYEVDLTSGALTPWPSFPSAAQSPLALTFDPADGSLLLALDASPGASRIVRLRRVGAGFVELPLGVVTGRATALLVDTLGDVLVAVDGAAGGVFRVPRHGGATTTVIAQRDVTAMWAFPGLAGYAAVGISGTAGPPATDPGVAWLDVDNGQFSPGPTFFAGWTPRGITGVFDLPTAVPRMIVAHDDGTLAVAEPFMTPPVRALATTPVLPPGGAATMQQDGGSIAVLVGDARHPFVHTFAWTAALGGSVVLSQVGGALLGDPVDCAFVPSTVAQAVRVNCGCGVAAELAAWTANGLPQLGNAAFTMDLAQALPLQAALLVVGFDELPGIPLANGCLVHVLPLASALHVADAAGDAAQPLPIPASPVFSGTLLFAQWLQLDGGVPALTSRTLALRVGP